MNLKPIINITISKDGKSFIFADNTTEDNRTTSTNYWNGTTPRYNTNISLDTTDATFKPDKIYKVDLFITDPSKNVYSFIDITVPKSIRTKTIENTNISQTDIISDGVYIFDYYLKNQFTTASAYTGSLSSNIITFNPQVPASLEIGMYIVIGSVYYEITALTSTTATLATALQTNVSSTTLTVAYKYQHLEVFDYNINCCITNQLAAAGKTDCNCISDALQSAVNMNTLLIGAKAQAVRGMLTKAQETVDLITKVCNSEDYDCKC